MPKETFAARFENLARICEFVTSVSREAGFDEADTYSVELATNEACTNIIEYAYSEGAQGRIECSIEADEKGVTIVLRDWGRPFDASTVPEENFDVPLEELGPRGAGLRLMRGAVDEVVFEPLPGEGNRLTIRKFR
jgi:serine/threonine-protein kinase RsbW